MHVCVTSAYRVMLENGSSHPLRLEPPGDFYAFFTGDSFFITCIPDPGIGANRLAWQTPNKKDITHTRGRVHVEPSVHNILGLELVVEEVRYKDQGVFICSAVVDGREIRIKFTLKVYCFAEEASICIREKISTSVKHISDFDESRIVADRECGMPLKKNR
ncbi:uncharacterized protein TNIN_59341 [Trichonephila inaurata madagascariensis]|uniref:Ig-like domain-containing protein n=1 Tax=Trichonephila inaurata madagascariensis TaxID=2747483 RepID=A0A8X7CK17_9ARAC|nr:uncharacterized protein TNIN_59341 [Trichonephila inaurata madagascariensis]